jgi:hypothetical protein
MDWFQVKFLGAPLHISPWEIHEKYALPIFPEISIEGMR